MIPSVLKEVRFEDNSAVPDYLQLVRKIEHLIRSGKLKEGQRLPSTAEMVDYWGINIKRVQRAMGALVSMGLLQRFPKRGTFVNARDNRPAIGILVGPDLLPGVHQFNRLLTASLESQILEKGLTPRIYDSLSNLDSPKWKRSHEELAYDLRHRSFAGFLLQNLFRGKGRAEEKIIDQLHDKYAQASYGLSHGVDFCVDYYDFAYRSVIELAKAGCRQIAYSPPKVSETSSLAEEPHLAGFTDALAACGLTAPPHAIFEKEKKAPQLSIPFPTLERTAYAHMEKVLREWKQKNYEPDGIILSDDINARGIIAAIETHLERRQKPPEFAVLANQEAEHFYVLPAFRYSISVTELATAMMDRLSQQMLGEPVRTEVQTIRGVWLASFR